MSSLRLDRAALADTIRSSSQFRTLTRQIEHKTVQSAQRLAATKVKRRTGAYLGNFETTITPLHQTANLVRLRLFNTQRHAVFIEEGTRPHIIRPRRASILAFDVGGRRVFARSVNHPGTRPHHVIRDTLLAIARGVGL